MAKSQPFDIALGNQPLEVQVDRKDFLTDGRDGALGGLSRAQRPSLRKLSGNKGGGIVADSHGIPFRGRFATPTMTKAGRESISASGGRA